MARPKPGRPDHAGAPHGARDGADLPLGIVPLPWAHPMTPTYPCRPWTRGTGQAPSARRRLAGTCALDLRTIAADGRTRHRGRLGPDDGLDRRPQRLARPRAVRCPSAGVRRLRLALACVTASDCVLVLRDLSRRVRCMTKETLPLSFQGWRNMAMFAYE